MNHAPPTHAAGLKPAARRSLILLLFAVLLTVWLFALVGTVQAQSITLRHQAPLDAAKVHAAGGVTLGMVADLDGFTETQAKALGALVVTDASAPVHEVRLDELRIRLRDAGLNLGLITLRGFAVCRLDAHVNASPVVPANPVAGGSESDALLTSAVAAALPAEAVDTAHPATLRGLIETHFRAVLDLPADEVVLAFDPADEAALMQSTLGSRYVITPIGDARLGRMNVRIERTAGFGDASVQTVGVRVGWKTKVLVARRDIQRHERFGDANVELLERVLDRDLDGELFDPASVRGAVAAAMVRAGEPVRLSNLGQPVLVKRGQAVTVRVQSGGFSMSTTGFAEHDAALHEPVQVRHDARKTHDTRTFRAWVVGAGQVSTAPAFPLESKEHPSLVHAG